MPTFQTPHPITARVQANSGSIEVIASDRSDTVVEVRPHDESRPADVRSAEEARIDYANGRLTVTPAKFGFLGARMGAVDIVVELPSRSRLRAEVVSADVDADGEYGELRVDSVSARTTVQSVVGSAKIATVSGETTIASLEGELKFQSASGPLAVQRLRGNVKSATASGDVSVAAAQRGSIVAQTSSGQVDVGVPEGTAARLDVMTGSGTVTNQLQDADGPADTDQTLLVHVRTGSGDVDVHRAVQEHGTISG